MNDKIVILRARKGVPGVGRRLARHFNCNEVTALHHPKRKIRPGTIIFNYGRSVYPVWLNEAIDNRCRIINTPYAVGRCVDKLETLQFLDDGGIPIPHFTYEHESAYNVQQLADNKTLVVRHIVNGKKGKGIEFIKDGEDVPSAPLYTAYYDKTHEYRVHVFDGKVIDFVQKKRMGKKKLAKLGLDKPNMLVRNRGLGWAFCRNDIDHDPLIERIAIDACADLGIDYAGVDILAKWEGGKLIDAVVCEVNSAPGMSDKNTFKAYTDAIQHAINRWRL